MPRVTNAQRERRRDKAAEWRSKGYAIDQICRSLRPPTHPSTITADLNTRRSDLAGAPRAVRAGSKRRPEDPEPFDWLAEPPPPPPPPGYLLRSPVPRIQALLSYLQDSDARNVYAFNVDEAEQTGDDDFLVESQVAIADLIKTLQELQGIALDAAKQGEAKQPKTLLPEQVFRQSQSLKAAGTLPPRGAGVLPTRLELHLMGMMYAGIPLDDKALAKAASRQAHNIVRARKAAEELKKAFPDGL